MSISPEKELEQFLAGLPTYQRKAFEKGISSWTEDEAVQACGDLFLSDNAVRENYVRFVERVPAKWREYRERQKREWGQAALIGMPANPQGAPRKDALANEAEKLKEAGLSYARIAKRLNSAHGEGTTTGENIRGLLKSRRLKARKAAPPPG